MYTRSMTDMPLVPIGCEIDAAGCEGRVLQARHIGLGSDDYMIPTGEVWSLPRIGARQVGR